MWIPHYAVLDFSLIRLLSLAMPAISSAKSVKALQAVVLCVQVTVQVQIVIALLDQFLILWNLTVRFATTYVQPAWIILLIARPVPEIGLECLTVFALIIFLMMEALPYVQHAISNAQPVSRPPIIVDHVEVIELVAHANVQGASLMTESQLIVNFASSDASFAKPLRVTVSCAEVTG